MLPQSYQKLSSLLKTLQRQVTDVDPFKRPVDPALYFQDLYKKVPLPCCSIVFPSALKLENVTPIFKNDPSTISAQLSWQADGALYSQRS